MKVSHHQPTSTLITLKAAPNTEDTKQISVQNADADIPGQAPDADIPVSNADDPVNLSQDKGGIGVEQTSPFETSTASTEMPKTTQKLLLVKNQKDEGSKSLGEYANHNRKLGLKFS